MRAAFRPEFLNRLDEIVLFHRLSRTVDEIVLFHRLSRTHMDTIVDIQIGRLERLLAGRNIALKLDAAARAWLADAGYDSVYGARPLRRVIQRALQNPLAGLILEGKSADGGTATVSAGKDGLVINGIKAASA